jgi:hypothetical protein
VNARNLHDKLLELNYQLTIKPIEQHCSILADIGQIEEHLASLCGLSVEAIGNAIAYKLPDYARRRIREDKANDCLPPSAPEDPKI